MKPVKQLFDELVSSLPAEYSGDLSGFPHALDKTLVILDDDPTGCQTVKDVPILTTWDLSSLSLLLEKQTPAFFILTNTRSLDTHKACSLTGALLDLLLVASEKTGRDCVIISRSDSTLRGHYPAEPETIIHKMKAEDPLQCFIPAFFQGGRYTWNDVHYVKEGKYLIPAAETPFAKDSYFGFSSSGLKKYVSEKYRNKVHPDDVLSFPLENLRNFGPEYVYRELMTTTQKVCIVNAMTQKDLDVFALGALKAMREGKNLFFRTAASFINSIANIPVPELKGGELVSRNKKNGVLIVVGSYVPKSSGQLNYLLENSAIRPFVLNVEEVLKGASFGHFSAQISGAISKGDDCVLYTGRKLISSENREENLNIGRKISDTLVGIVEQLTVFPRCIITKGGITSHVIITDSLKIRQSVVLGQVLPGVPVINSGDGRFRDIPVVIFPGNVGQENSLFEVYNKMKNNE